MKTFNYHGLLLCIKNNIIPVNQSFVSSLHFTSENYTI